MTRGPAAATAAATLVTIAFGPALPAQQDSNRHSTSATPELVRLQATAHPPVPLDLLSFWYAPGRDAALAPAQANFVKGVRLLEDEDDAAAALPLLSHGSLATTSLSDYARYYTGQALLRLQRYPDAEAAFAAVAARDIAGHLPEDAALGQAEAREAQLDFAGAVRIYEGLVARTLAAPHVVLARMAAAAEQAGDPGKAVDAYRRVYYGYPLSTESTDAEASLTRLNAWDDEEPPGALELARADTLFQARRWPAARASYERARGAVSGGERDRVHVRIAACDVQLRRYEQAFEPLKGQRAGAHADEATFYYLSALRGVGERAAYEREALTFADRRRQSPFAEEALNNLASHFIIGDEDDRADEVFRMMIERHPAGRYAERAYWRSGWWSYRARRYAEAAMLFDRGAAQFPRSDYRPSWLFWSGRAWRKAGREALGADRLRLAATDYFNSYYGRAALKHLSPAAAARVTSTLDRQAAPAPSVAFPTADRVAELIAVGLHQEALNELQYAQRLWGDSPRLAATIALVQNRLGNLRLGINAMKRAYPQWMAAGGESLPVEIQKVIFPLEYWPLLRKHAAARGLDPYLVAALVAQESTFDPVIRSSANAVGLMQVLPSTGRQFARRLKIPTFTPARLTDPETNVRLGTAIFAESLRKFGGVHYALAAYNAGDHRVTEWRRERPGLPQDEFIDDIPFPETQNYVKRILGTAEDYRRLYGK